MKPSIDLNADLGEGYPNDAELLALVTSASLSCGAHAGDPETIRRALSIAASLGVAVGAHPGYPDRENFGRVERPDSSEEIRRFVSEQIADLALMARSQGVALRFVKPHGALYNRAQRDSAVASGLIEAVKPWNLPILGQPGSALEVEARRRGLVFVTEGFPDRRYGDDGRLVPRSEPDALLHDRGEVATQVARLAEQGMATLCIHGDHPQAVENARVVRQALKDQDIAIRFWDEIQCPRA